jgi:hypothetical protein
MINIESSAIPYLRKTLEEKTAQYHALEKRIKDIREKVEELSSDDLNDGQCLREAVRDITILQKEQQQVWKVLCIFRQGLRDLGFYDLPSLPKKPEPQELDIPAFDDSQLERIVLKAQLRLVHATNGVLVKENRDLKGTVTRIETLITPEPKTKKALL